jgi:ribosomal protein S18 acetylase RimI-like enzyme
VSVVIRPGVPSDLEDLLPLVRAYREFYECVPDAERERTFMDAHLRGGTSAIFLAFDGDDAVGFAQLFPTSSTVGLGRSLILEDLYVVPQSRRQGVAAALIRRSVAYARDVGAVSMFLETAKTNTAAQALYERAGWEREGRFYKYNASL